jgi:hypothetical protein
MSTAMKRVCSLLYLVALTIWPGLSPAVTLDEVMERHVEAMGGLENILKVRSSVTTADITMAGMEGAALTYFKHPDKYRTELMLPIGRMVRMTSGGECWTIDMNGQMREMSGEESQDMMNGLFLASNEYLEPEYRGSAVRLIGEEEIEDRTYYKILMQPPGGRDVTLYVDSGTYLIGFTESTLQMLMVRVWQEDYRPIEGVMVPFRTRESTGLAAMEVDITVTSYELNPALDDGLFVPTRGSERDCYITGGSPARMEFSLRSFHVYVPAMVNGVGPYSFILDSGSGLSVVGSDVARELGLSRAGQLPAFGAGGHDIGSFITLDSISIGNVVISDIVAGELDLTALNRFALEPIDGILGYDLFSRFVIRIEYYDSLLTIFLPDDASVPGGSDTLDLQFEHNHPMVEAVMNDSISGRFRIDTGSMNYLDLYTHVVRRHKLIEESPSTVADVKIRGLGGQTMELTLGRLRSFTLGKTTMRDLPCGFSTADSGLFAVEGIDGNIGGGLLAKFTCTFDYPQSKLYLTPGPDFHEPDEMVTAGIVAARQGGGIVVSQVLAGSPAEKKGVKVGESIIRIGRKPVQGLSLFEIHRLLNSDDSDRVELELESGGVVRRVVLLKSELF